MKVMMEIADERCTCGHLKSEHGDSLFWGDGHGACKGKSCNCTKFTWIEFVFEK